MTQSKSSFEILFDNATMSETTNKFFREYFGESCHGKFMGVPVTIDRNINHGQVLMTKRGRLETVLAVDPFLMTFSSSAYAIV
jgi:hypothetical protein